MLELLDPAGMQRTHRGRGGRWGDLGHAMGLKGVTWDPPKKKPTLNMVILLIAKLSASG